MILIRNATKIHFDGLFRILSETYCGFIWFFFWTQNGVGFVGSGEPRILPTNNIFQKTLNKQIGKTIASNIHAYVFSNPQKFISTIINESTVSHQYLQAIAFANLYQYNLDKSIIIPTNTRFKRISNQYAMYTATECIELLIMCDNCYLIILDICQNLTIYWYYIDFL